MQFEIGDRCARGVRAAAFMALALCALGLVNGSKAFATFTHNGSPDVDIQVVGKAGPISGYTSFNRYGEGGLPSINIYEKAKGDDEPFWADIEIEVKVRFEQDPWDHFTGGLDYHFMNWWCGGHGGPYDDPYDEPEDEGPEGVVIGIDKFVKNKTDLDWQSFGIELGTGLGDEFVRSEAMDGLYFVNDPMAKEVTDNFNNPPQQTEDTLVWTSAPNDGQQVGETSTFWFGVHVPGELFEEAPQKRKKSFWSFNSIDGYWTARFTIRQHGTDTDMPIDPDIIVPEPSTILLGVLGIIGFYTSRAAQRQVDFN